MTTIITCTLSKEIDRIWPEYQYTPNKIHVQKKCSCMPSNFPVKIHRIFLINLMGDIFSDKPTDVYKTKQNKNN